MLKDIAGSKLGGRILSVGCCVCKLGQDSDIYSLEDENVVCINIYLSHYKTPYVQILITRSLN